MIKNISVIYNPISGKGQAKHLAENHIIKFLEKNGFNTQLFQSKKNPQEYINEISNFNSCDLIIVIGGDGTLLGLLPLLPQTQIPVYMIPAGNESLFAQIYHMDRDENLLLQAIKENKLKTQYYGIISNQDFTLPFFCMASMGLDSLTVKYIGERSGAINNFKYIWYGLKALINFSNPIVSIKADGVEIVSKENGYLIVANSSSYAHDLRLVPHASPDLNHLDLAFLPNSNRWDEIKKGIWMAQRKQAKLPLQYFTAKQFEITIHENDFPLQVDGEYFQNKDIPAERKITFKMADKPIQVLTIK